MGKKIDLEIITPSKVFYKSKVKLALSCTLNKPLMSFNILSIIGSAPSVYS